MFTVCEGVVHAHNLSYQQSPVQANVHVSSNIIRSNMSKIRHRFKMDFPSTVSTHKTFLSQQCALHFQSAPVKMVRASKQYMYDEMENQYLDCINSHAHVGHCHPHVVRAGQDQLATLTVCPGFLCDVQAAYAKRIVETLPERLCVCFFVNSGTEANNMAVRLARAFTGNHDIVVPAGSYHGNSAEMMDISPLKLKRMGKDAPSYLHIAELPDQYRGAYAGDARAGDKYAAKYLTLVKEMGEQGRKPAAYIHEPLNVCSGVYVPPPGYLSQVYKHTRAAGGLVIASEMQTGLGRCGDKWWGFQTQDVIPDILTCAKPLGNGFPLGVVVTSREIADNCGAFLSSFGGNPMACSTGLAVLDVINNEKLLTSATQVGRCLFDGLKGLQAKHDMIGDIRGMGLIAGIDVVESKESKKPAQDRAELIAYKMKDNHILIANTGPERNVLLMAPPMCFTCENARHVIKVLDQLLSDISAGLVTAEPEESTSDDLGPRLSLESLVGQAPAGNKRAAPSSASGSNDGPAKKPKYEDMD